LIEKLFLHQHQSIFLQSEVLQLVAGILHLGNVLFAEVGSETAAVHLDESEFFYFIKIDF
jgi:myosin heavy subunit